MMNQFFTVRQTVKYILLHRIFIIVSSLMISSLIGCEPFADSQDYTESRGMIFRAQTLDNVSTPSINPDGSTSLRVMTWNIKYGAARIPFWFDCWGDRVQLTREEVEQNLGEIAALINEIKPDILLLEEIELNSRRSAYMNMVQRLLDQTELNYGAYFSTWDSRYIPSEGLGRMNLGNAILSTFPIVDSVRIKQAERTDLDALTHPFYIKRAIGRAEIEIGEKSLAAFVVHTEAYDQDGTKQTQIEQIFKQVSDETLPFLLGGDFNELPPTAIQREAFNDERTSPVCGEDFAQPPYTPEKMNPFYNEFSPWVTLDEYGTTAEEQSRFFTHSVLGPDEVNELNETVTWNRTLDYLFGNKGSEWEAGAVFQRSGQEFPSKMGQERLVSNPEVLSDHAPVFGIWRVTL